ncbi:MAG: hypothetical protein ACYSQZ_09205, partial [Planctomycetota bacterium]
QHGLDLTVPSGYPNDTFGPIWATSGERVIIDPNPGGNTTSTVQNIFHIDARGAAVGVGADIERGIDRAFEKKGIRANSIRRTR